MLIGKKKDIPFMLNDMSTESRRKRIEEYDIEVSENDDYDVEVSEDDDYDI